MKPDSIHAYPTDLEALEQRHPLHPMQVNGQELCYVVTQSEIKSLIAELRASRKVVEMLRSIRHITGDDPEQCPACVIEPFLRELASKGTHSSDSGGR